MTELTFGLLGLGLGGLTAMLAMAIVIVHRGSGVLNFATGAVGMFGAYVFYHLRSGGTPFAVDLVAGLASSAAIGAAMHLVVMRSLVRAAMTTKIVATLGLMSLLTGAASLIFAPQGNILSVPSFLPTKQIHIGQGNAVAASLLIIAAIAIAVTIVLVAIERKTRFGLATSAVAENRTVAASMGWSPDFIAATTWAASSVLAAGAAILAAPIAGLDVINLTLLVVPALAAALVGRFESFPLALLGGMIIGVAQGEVGRYVSDPGWVTAAPLLVIVVVLVLQGRALPSKSQLSERLTSVGPGRIGVGAAIVLVAGLALSLFAGGGWVEPITLTFLFGLVVLSVVAVTGFAGQLSLAQLELAGMGAFFVSVFTVKAGLPMWLAILLGALATVPIGLVVAIPAVRTRGSALAISSLALASVIDALILSDQNVAGKIGGSDLPDFRLFGIDFNTITHPRNFAILSLVVLGLCMLALSNLRRGAVGRRLLAVRANERASAALGLSVPGIKLFVFALAAFVAALGGGLIEAQLPFADYSAFSVLGSIQSVLEAVIGGLGWVAGAPVGGTAADGALGSKVVSLVVSPGNWLVVISGVTALLVVVQSPDGIVPFNLKLLARLVGRVFTRKPRARPPVAAVSGQVTGRRVPVTVEVRNVTVRFGGQTALDDVSLTIRPGEILGLIGPNGAGKSTLIDVVSGFQAAERGEVRVDDVLVSGPPSRRARKGLTRTFQSLELFEDMSILDNLLTAADACPPLRYLSDLAWPRASRPSDIVRAAIGYFDLADVLDKRPSELDYARRRQAAVARALSADPTVLLIDEPAAGLDAAQRRELSGSLRRLSAEWGIGILLVEHDVDLVFSVCDQIVGMDAGQVIARGTPAEVRHSPALIAAYLGVADDPAETSPASGSPA